MTTDRERHQAEQNEAQAMQPKARLMYARRIADGFQIAMEDAQGITHLLAVKRADEPGLNMLGEDDRSRVVAAVLAAHRPDSNHDAA